MKFRGMTLIEVSVMVLVATIIFHAAINLMFIASERFGKQEESVVCATNASMIISHLRKDFDSCIATGPMQDLFQFACSAVTFKDQILIFNVIGSKKGSREIQYVYDEKSREISRNDKGVSRTLGDKRVTKFFVVYQILCSDGVIRSFPFDPESVTPEPPLQPNTKALRTWIKFILTLEEKTKGQKKPVNQEYCFRLFPFRLNRQLQSMWVQ